MIELIFSVYLFLSVFGLLYLFYKVVYKKDGKYLIKWNVIIYFLGWCIFSYARFIEPYWLIEKETSIKVGWQANVVLISDMHLGEVKRAEFLQKIVNKINTIPQVDFVIIAGDFTFLRKKKENFDYLFSPLADIKVPIYAVLGNHDTQNPGPDIEKELILSLEKHKVHLLDNESMVYKDIHILGLGDHWIPNDKVELIDQFKKEDNLLIIAHNPDTVMKYESDIADITVSGHTHAGQIRIPYFYKKVIPCEGPFDVGGEIYNNHKVFVSPGVGEVGLPMRFLNRPEIDILKFY